MTGDVSGDLTGRRLGNYRIDSVLGKGGMSVTYQATDVRLGRKVALKVIGDHLGTDAEFRERFVDEARNTSAIDHANIVPLYDFGELEGMLYIAMRMVDGGDLAGLISAGPIAPARALALLDQVADALDTLHNRGLVHLDVKPANVLVTSKETSREHVYVADFGLTRRGATGHRTRGGDFLGSPTYAAPEHLRGEPLDGRTDQYALTCVLYACLTGTPPFKGDVPTVIKGHLNGEPPSVSRVVALPAEVDDVIRKGMAKNPADRYPNCVAMIAAARVALGPLAASDTPPGPPGSGGVQNGLGGLVAPGATGGQGGQSGQGAQGAQGEGAGMPPFGQQPGYRQGGPRGPGGAGGQGNDPAHGQWSGPGGQGVPQGAGGPGGSGGPGNDPAHGAHWSGPGGPGVPGGPGAHGAPGQGTPGQPRPGGDGNPWAGPGGWSGAPQNPGQPPGVPAQGPAPGYGYPGLPPQGPQAPQGYPGQQGHPGQPAYGYPNQQQGYPGMHPGYGPPGDPMRLRPPSPAGGAGAFQQSRGGGRKWLWIGLGIVVLAGLIVGAIFLFGGGDSGGTTTPTTTAPNIPVGPGGPSGSQSGSPSLKPPPASIPIQPSR
ncbi:protein kinase [Amycolatopsis carbonis]|uniref:non-specific serine/threonine protein kinase n=1 Tax=Amycolatopsis carbonis TaxID=715471 RepID=A0A9Y2IM01_9PSEU|nr:serine/threonine protein kinase [Amycolatopsis sp. 2-15]WIX81471.1 protein kinase [Amycolatopsis sp. 2-15]